MTTIKKIDRHGVLRAALVVSCSAALIYLLRPPLPILSGGDIEPIAVGGAILVVTFGYVLFALLAMTAAALWLIALTFLAAQIIDRTHSGLTPREL
ncbi:MAG TPA: hypothetical protein VJ726_11680 [Candidatus Limnocylindria bacterium]|nr:hypothetical protein [Candidatus Limnocylindria bacterium]